MDHCRRSRVDSLNRRAATASLVFLALLAPCMALAHEGAATSFAAIEVSGTSVRYSLTTSSQPLRQADRPAGGAGAMAADPARMTTLVARHLRIEADGHRCQPGAADFVPPAPPRLSTTYNIEFGCSAPVRTLRVTDGSFDFLGRDGHVLVQVSVQGGGEPSPSTVLLADERRSAEFEITPAAPAAPAGADGTTAADPAIAGTVSATAMPAAAIGFLPLGIQHILEGWDHLLFLLALVLPGGRVGNLIRIVTAFTIAHSLTLAAAALEVVSVPPAPVEALIALSIAWVAAENLARVRPMSRRWAVAFAFGLIHGFGFANVLRDIGLPRDALLPSLLWFNIGIELGQLLVVLLLVPLLAWLGGMRFGKSVPPALSGMILLASLVLLVQRL